MKNQTLDKRLVFALHGIKAAWYAEKSFKQQTMVGLGVLIILIWKNPPLIWWALLLLNCGLVLAAELFNTALEHALDHLHPDTHPTMKIVKDCAAGAVLLTSLAAACVFMAFIREVFFAK